VIRVVAAVVRREGRYLLGLRPAEKRHGGLWEFPGGKTDPGESLLDAARRELSEEMDLRVTGVGRRLLSVPDTGSGFVIDFLEIRVSGEPTALEHAEIGWFRPDEMTDMALAPADERFARQLLDAAEANAGVRSRR